VLREMHKPSSIARRQLLVPFPASLRRPTDVHGVLSLVAATRQR
jgi:hypothetical protein